MQIVIGQLPRLVRTEVDADFRHDRDDVGVDGVGWLGSRRSNNDTTAANPLCHGCSHL
jgi:hypothetical protein